MVAVAERYDATMYRTGGYKGSHRSLASSSKAHTPKKENTYRKPSITTTRRNTVKGKAPAKKSTYTKSNKPSKAEMDCRKAEGACFYCGECGHMANKCPKKEVTTNHVRLSEESPDSSEGEYEPDTDSTEELDGSGSITTYKTTVGTAKDRRFQALEFTININGKPARALADTGTIGGTLISNKFVTTHNIRYTARKNPVTLKMAGKHPQKQTLRLIHRRWVMTQATHLLRPMCPVRPDVRCNAPPHPTLPDATWQRSLRPDATWRPPYVWTTPDSFSHLFFLLMRR